MNGGTRAGGNSTEPQTPSTDNFDAFFQAAMGYPPYGYQRRLACGRRADESERSWLSHGTACASRLIDIPTGLGKTAAVVLAWLWNRFQIRNPKSEIRNSEWPSRLVYCLPMRTLVEQTDAEVGKWLRNLLAKPGELGLGEQAKEDLRWLVEHSPIILMGGEENDAARREWDVWPEKPAILIGTQDMLLSRALNRGYGMSRYRWPMHFGLLNNDCLWVMDETQLMGVGVETSAQLDGFRHNGQMPTLGLCPTWWMSATLEEERLTTVDHPKPDDGWLVEKLSDAEQSSGRPHNLITASKKASQARLKDAPAPLALSSTTKDGYAKKLAALIKECHQTDTLTLVVVNRVGRAQEVFKGLVGGRQPLHDREKVALIHSRFRPVDRERHMKLLFGDKDGKGDRIVIATQAVEAGVDVSARLLITELAPWSSLVQRIGRCNRRGDTPDAEFLWVDIQVDGENDKLSLPYTGDELAEARKALTKLTDANPRALRDVQIPEKSVIRPVIRRCDLVDLFDTTPDLCGQDLDISRYIRDGKDNDVQFFWRKITGDAPTKIEPPPHRDELCRVSIGEASEFLGKKTTHAWRWNPLAEQWEEARSARPGGIYLVDVACGGYSDDLGWTGEQKDKTTPRVPAKGESETYAANSLTFDCDWQLLAEHTKLVVETTKTLTGSLKLDSTLAATLVTAALWHDVGKAHETFQKALLDGPHIPPDRTVHYAKSKNPPKSSAFPRERHGFRHELASALAWLLAGPVGVAERDLIAYLIAAHHGKVRLSIRSLPDEKGNPERPDDLFARGIWQDDPVPAVPVGEITTPPVTLDLSFMQMGEGKHGPSWLARMIALRDRLGPFRLAFLETILRAADTRASKQRAAQDVSRDTSAQAKLYEPSQPYGAATALSPEEKALVDELVADGLSIQKKFRPEPLYKQTGKGHYEGATVEEIQRAREKGKQGDKS